MGFCLVGTQPIPPGAQEYRPCSDVSRRAKRRTVQSSHSYRQTLIYQSTERPTGTRKNVRQCDRCIIEPSHHHAHCSCLCSNEKCNHIWINGIQSKSFINSFVVNYFSFFLSICGAIKYTVILINNSDCSISTRHRRAKWQHTHHCGSRCWKWCKWNWFISKPLNLAEWQVGDLLSEIP